MLKNNRIFKYICYAELFICILFLSVLIYKYYNPDRLAISLDEWCSNDIEYNNGWYIDESMPRGSNTLLYGPYIELPAGVYEAAIHYECDTDQVCELFANNDNKYFIHSDKALLDKNANACRIQFELTNTVNNLELLVSYNGKGSFFIKDIDIYCKSAYIPFVKNMVLIFCVVSASLFLFYVFLKIIIKNKLMFFINQWKNNRNWRLVCYAEALFIVLLIMVSIYQYYNPRQIDAPLSNWKSSHIVYSDGWYIDEGMLNADASNIMIYGPYLSLPEGKYSIKVDYQCDEDQICEPYANNDNKQYIQGDRIKLEKQFSSVEFDIVITQKIDNLELLFLYNNRGSFTINSIDIFVSSQFLLYVIVGCLIFFCLLNFLYLAVKAVLVSDNPKIYLFKIKLQNLFWDDRTTRQRFFAAFTCSLAFGFSFIIFGPCELFIANIDDFSFAFSDVFFAMFLICLLFVTVLSFGLCLLKGNFFNCALNILFSITLAGYVQGFINIDHGALTGASINWTYYKNIMLLNLLFWLFVMVVSFGVMYFNVKQWQKSIKVICTIVILAQAAAFVGLILEGAASSKNNTYISVADMFEVAEQNNVIFFLLDRFDNRYMDSLLEQHPEWNEKLSDFTYYHNFTGSYANTRPSIVYLFTGVQNDYAAPWSAYFNKAWHESQLPLLTTVHEAGYKTGIYGTDYALGNAKNYAEVVDNVRNKEMTVDYKLLICNMANLAAYRYLPEMMKPYFIVSNSDFADILTVDAEDDIYVEDDPAFWNMYRQQNLSINKELKGVFLFYHLIGAHDPYIMNENAERISASATGDMYAQITGNMNMIFQYIDELKEKGIYENTTIIITTDHARPPGVEGNINDVSDSRVLTLLIKPAGSNLNSSMQISNKQICQDNLRASIISYFGLDTASYGRTIESVSENEEMTRYVWMRGEFGEMNNKMHTFEIKGDANDFANWNLIAVNIMQETAL